MTVIVIKHIQPYIALMRVKSWVKNIFVFLPLVFSLTFLAWAPLWATVVMFAAFCVVSSSVYVFNDICDADKDAAHPVKCRRPIASGKISKRNAAVFALLLAVTGIAAGLAVNMPAEGILMAYLALNTLYSLWLKHRPLYDCFCIAAGFVLRVYAGGMACGEPVSDWLFLTIVAMSLFMAFGKRRGEFVKVDHSATREVLQYYNQAFLQGMVFASAGLTVVFYSLWAMNRGSHMIYTVPLILFIVSKYLLLIHSPQSHGDPTTVILSDKTLLAACGVYGIVTLVLLV